MRARWFVFALAAASWPVSAHAPYEHVRATIIDPSGRQLQIVAQYTDGIIAADPVTVVARDSTGTIVAKAERARDAIVRCPSYDACRVFLYDPPLNLFPSHVLRLDAGGFVPESVDRHLIVGAMLPIRHHYLDLLIASLAFALVPIVAQLLGTRRRTPAIILAWIVFVPISLLWLAFWWLGTMLNSLAPLISIVLMASSFAVLPLVIRSLRPQHSTGTHS